MKWFNYVFAILSIVGFMFTPMTGDLKVFFSGANQAKFINKNLLIGAYQEWELKSVFARTLTYAIYKLITLFVPFSSYGFEIAANFIYIVLVIIAVWLSVRLFFGKIDRESMLWKTALVSTCFFTTHSWCHMQVEMSCTLLIMVAFSLYVNVIKNKDIGKWKLFIAGVLIGSTFFFKSVLILLSVSVVAAVCIWIIYNDYKFSLKRLFIVISGSVTILVVNFLVILLINPSEIQNMLDAAAFQKTVFSTTVSFGNVVMGFICEFLKKSCFTPVVRIGMLAFACNFLISIRYKKWKLLLLHIVLWLMPSLFVLLSNKYFGYHFVVFIFPSIIEIAEMFYNKSKIKLAIAHIGIVYGVVTYLLYMSVFSDSFRGNVSMTRKAFQNRNEVVSQLNIEKSDMFLYLDDGNGSYLVGNESYIKYYYPLPLQRLNEDSTLECYTSTLEKVMKYDGKYISVYEKWFFNGKNDKIKEKIEKEYEWIGSYEVFVPPYSFYGEFPTRVYDIYMRK